MFLNIAVCILPSQEHPASNFPSWYNSCFPSKFCIPWFLIILLTALWPTQIPQKDSLVNFYWFSSFIFPCMYNTNLYRTIPIFLPCIILLFLQHNSKLAVVHLQVYLLFTVETPVPCSSMLFRLLIPPIFAEIAIIMSVVANFGHHRWSIPYSINAVLCCALLLLFLFIVIDDVSKLADQLVIALISKTVCIWRKWWIEYKPSSWRL